MPRCFLSVQTGKMDFVNLCNFCKENVSNSRESDLIEFKKMLPPGFRHCVCDLTVSAGDSISGVIRVNCTTTEEVEEWLKVFQQQTKMTFRLLYSKKHTGLKMLYYRHFKCKHNSRQKTNNSRIVDKNTNCPANMKITLQKTQFTLNFSGKKLYKRASRSTDPHIPEFPMCVTFQLNHNHSIDAADALKHRDVGDDAKAKITELLHKNHSPSSALEAYKRDLQFNNPTEYLQLVGDRYHCPDLQWCYRLYYKLFGKKHKLPNKNKSDDLSESENDDVAKTDLSESENNDVAKTNNSEMVENEQENEQTFIDFKETLNRIFDICESNKSFMSTAVQQFIIQSNKLNTLSQVQTALFTFGKYNDAATRLSSRGKSTGVARRKSAFLGKKMHLGHQFDEEHGYAVRDYKHRTSKIKASLFMSVVDDSNESIKINKQL